MCQRRVDSRQSRAVLAASCDQKTNRIPKFIRPLNAPMEPIDTAVVIFATTLG